MKNPLDIFFNLGNKVTKGDPIRKSQYDYYLYWIIFLAFVSIALTYYYNFFFKSASFSTIMWAIIITVFCWFNYYALGAFRTNYENMKKIQNIQFPDENKTKEQKIEPVDEMLKGFKQ